MKLRQIVNARETLLKLAKAPLPGKDAYKTAKLIKKLNGELEIFDSERMKTYKLYGDEKDGNITVRPEEAEDFKRDMEALLESDVEEFAPLKIKAPDYAFTAADMISLDGIVEFEEE